MAYQHMDIDAIVAAMTLEEKISFVGGKDFWCTRGIPRLGVPETMMCDGPTGLRKSMNSDEVDSGSVPATCFPTTVCLASTWNRDVVERVGKAIGAECRAESVSLLLAPGNNIKRSPLCGRNFEYYSEDPYAASQLAAAFVRGVQSEGVGATLKHYCANNQETNRFTVDESIDERTLREIYLAAFESVVRDAQPWSVMSSYNRVNGEYAVGSRRLITDVLRGEFGFKGFLVSDWGAVSDRAASVDAGMDLEMPGTYGATSRRLADRAKAGRLNLKELDACVRRLLAYVDRAAETLSKGAPKWDADAHHELAREAAAEAIVLLKNDAAALPLDASAQTIAVIGEFAAKPRYQGSGSSFVNATRTTSVLAELQKASSTVQYAAAYSIDAGTCDVAEATAAVELAARSDVAVVFVGLSGVEESEGFDRAHMRLPVHHDALVDAVAAANSNTIVVLTNASAVEMPWAGKVKAIVEAYLPGQAGATAVADVLLGKVNPSGKLSETFPLSLKHTPCYLNFPGKYEVTYAERVYVGYRYYDAVDMPVLFPFGHGLSYTSFEYSAPRVLKAVCVDTDTVEAEVTVTNTGTRAGAEVVQLYVRDAACSVDRPERELKAFEKVRLAPGESTTVRFSLDRRAFAYYDVARKDWVVEAGDFELLFGSSSRDLRGSATVTVTPAVAPPAPHFDKNSMIGDVCSHPATQCMSRLLMRDFSCSTMNPSLLRMFQAMEGTMPLRCMIVNTNGALNNDDVDALVCEANRLAAAACEKAK